MTRSKSGATIGVWLRPCEVRAFVELTKLRQGAREEVVILSMDCPMALSHREYDDWAVQGETEAGDVENGFTPCIGSLQRRWMHGPWPGPARCAKAHIP